MTNELSTFNENIQIRSQIFTIRGVQVMIDRDLARLYGVETKRLNEAVKRNKERFPMNFMFQMTEAEMDNWKSQIATSNLYDAQYERSLKMGLRRLPYAFTEQGVSQLSAVLKSKTAIAVSIRIMEAFVAMRHYFMANAGMCQRMERMEERQRITEHRVDQVFQRMDELAPTLPDEKLFLTGCVFDAWNYVSGLVRSAEKRVILIDKYVDERVLSLLNKRLANVSAEIYSRYDENFLVDLEKHNSQYPHIDFIQLPHHSHDRFLIIDDTVYLLGASVKDMGVGLCAITQMEVSAEEVLGAHRMHGKSNK